MATRRVIKAVLHNFLGSFTSRYSSYNGYWLFGFLVSGETGMDINLLGSVLKSDSTPRDVARTLARGKFLDQLAKHGLGLGKISYATVQIEIGSERIGGQVGSHQCLGSRVQVMVEVQDDRGVTWRSSMSFFVAPHNPRFERRSAGT